MKIVGFKESSLSEWEGHVSSIIWTAGCNWRCTYCHNKDLILNIDKLDEVTEDTIYEYIKTKEGWIDGLCITGGEPTIQPDLCDFIRKTKEKFDIGIKLETNGSNPIVIRDLLDNNLIDCLALDFKTMPNIALLELNKQKGNIAEVLKSFNISFEAADKIEVEYHTTLCPKYIKIDILEEMSQFLHNKGLWILQQYTNENVLNIKDSGEYEYDNDELKILLEIAHKHHNNIITKNINL
jgi:pyruvate formate lyase activating enzyme